MNTSTKTRIPYLDFLKFFAIACVFLGHSVERTTGNDFWDNPIWSFIYTFHMPLFMLLCGYFFGSSLKISFWEMCRKKFIQLVVPSISAFLIMYAFTAVTRYNPCPELINISVIGFFNTVWFLKSVFFCYLIGYASIRLLRSLPLAITVSTLAVNLIPAGNIDYVNFMLPMFWTGYLCEKKREAIQTHAGKLLAACLIAFLAMLPFWSGRMTVYMVPVDLIDWQTGSLDLHNLYVTLFRLGIGIAGSMVCFLSAPWVYKKISHWKIMPTFDRMGKSTLGLYWVQTFLLECALTPAGIYVDTAGSFVTGPVIAVIELTLCYQVVRLFRKNRYSRLLLLGEKDRK
ncbi:MAG TPA: acyltransferase family protein [Candidatus Phocaeicola excrementigallinarum]|nr:acyltransferase family protein [Candidatus Phocaeicola excrementigallinarum]